MRTVDYEIVQADMIGELKHGVLELLKKGWECQGSICITIYGGYGSTGYAQAMIKREPHYAQSMGPQ
jgi:hypothetical protein